MIKETYSGYDDKEQYYVFLNESKPVDPYLLLYGNQIKKDGWGVFLNLKNKFIDNIEFGVNHDFIFLKYNDEDHLIHIDWKNHNNPIEIGMIKIFYKYNVKYNINCVVITSHYKPNLKRIRVKEIE